MSNCGISICPLNNKDVIFVAGGDTVTFNNEVTVYRYSVNETINRKVTPKSKNAFVKMFMKIKEFIKQHSKGK